MTYIEERLQKHYNTVCKKYGEANVFFVSLCGSQNYNLATPKSDVDTKAVVFLTPEQLCYHEDISVELHIPNGAETEHCEVKDLATFCKMLLKLNLNFIEFFATDYYICNPKYQDLFDEFRSFQNTVVYSDVRRMVSSMYYQARNRYQKYLSGEGSNKDFVYAFKLLDFSLAVIYNPDESFKEMVSNCIRQRDMQKLKCFSSTKVSPELNAHLAKMFATMDEYFELEPEESHTNEAKKLLLDFCVRVYGKRF